MKAILELILHLLVTICKLLRPGGVKSVLAENLLSKQQLIVLKRTRKMSPNLRAIDRFILGFFAFFIHSRRLVKSAVLFQPSTILKFHQALVSRKYRLLFSSKKVKRKPGPQGPGQEIINAVLEMKRRNPRMGCPKIAQTITQVFGIEINQDIVRRILAKHYRPGSDGYGPSWLTFVLFKT